MKRYKSCAGKVALTRQGDPRIKKSVSVGTSDFLYLAKIFNKFVRIINPPYLKIYKLIWLLVDVLCGRNFLSSYEDLKDNI